MEKNNKIVFLVDDNPVQLSTGQAALQDEYNVVTIPSGEKLLFVLNNNKPDLILLDVEMPGLSGYDVIKELKANPKTADIPVIFLTAKSEEENECLGLSLGAVDYIAKPFSKPILLQRVRLHLKMRSLTNELEDFNKNLSKMVEERTRDISALQDAVITWAAEIIEFRDEQTGKHVDRVQSYLKLLIEKMKETALYADEVKSWNIDAFLKSALLHDVGKIKIGDAILLKEARLTDEEFAKIKNHSLYGKTLLESLQSKVSNQIFLEYAQMLALRHHERWDGTGYPGNLKGTEIPLQARMMALADVFDALISDRPYKKAFTHEKAIQIISEGRETQFDPDLTDLFISLSNEIREVSEKINLRGK